MTDKKTNAWVVRVAPSGDSQLDETLKTDQAILGWAVIDGLLDKSLNHGKIREKLKKHFSNINNRVAGSWAGSIRRFIHEIKAGDYILIPAYGSFYIAKAKEDDAIFLADKVADDAAYRRNVEWLNNKKPVPHILASSALQKRLKSRQTVVYADDLVGEIEVLLEELKEGKPKSFHQELQDKLAEETLQQLRNGKMNPEGFEQLIQKLMKELGAKSSKITVKSQDHGVDVTAIFDVAGISKIQVAVQAKHYQPRPDVPAAVVDQLIRGIEHESFAADIPTIAMVITTGEFSAEAEQRAEEYMNREDCKCIELRLIAGEELARLIVENGI